MNLLLYLFQYKSLLLCFFLPSAHLTRCWKSWKETEEWHHEKGCTNTSLEMLNFRVQRHLPMPFGSERTAKAELLVPCSKRGQHEADLLKHQNTVTVKVGHPSADVLCAAPTSLT